VRVKVHGPVQFTFNAFRDRSLGAFLWAAAGASAVLLIVHRRQNALVAELLLVFVLAVEGLVAIKELGETRGQLRFDAMLRIYDFARELHSLAFSNLQLWKSMKTGQPDAMNEDDIELSNRYTQLFCNLVFLEWEVREHGYLDEKQWEPMLVDATLSLNSRGMQQFWPTCRIYYTEDFRRFVDDIRRLPPPVSSQT
jgi:hypothetical protein